jgi:hypothetical protein
MHGITIDGKDNVVAGNGGYSGEVLGKFYFRSARTARPRATRTPPISTGRLKLKSTSRQRGMADGCGNRCVIVDDADKGTFAMAGRRSIRRRANCSPPIPLPQSGTGALHCASLANDGRSASATA